MTKADKPVKRESYSSVRVRRQLRPLVLELHPTWVTVRPKGTRTTYTVSVAQIYQLGAANAAREARQAKAAARLARSTR